MRERAVLLWSGGKDSALALHEVRKSGRYEVAVLLTTVTKDYDRVSMHGVRRALLERQADALGIALEIMLIPRHCLNAEYEARMAEALAALKPRGIHVAVAGDIFLEDVRRYREERLRAAGMRTLFPLWRRDTGGVARAFIDEGFRAVTACVDAHVLDRSWVGRAFDAGFLADLPPGVDPCGENGEFHTFVFGGPMFEEEVRWVRGDVILRDDRFYYCDLVTETAG